MKTVNDILPAAKQEWRSEPYLYWPLGRPLSAVCQYMGKYYIMPGAF